ncbi:MAG TPA: T9SS type A sorting domain-containing protein [Hymenobacter sp.]
MKKSLLFLSLWGLVGSAHAQSLGPWTEVNIENPATFAPGYLVTDVKTVSSTVAWAVVASVATEIPNAFLRTSNASGDRFYLDAISATNSTADFQAGNISSVNATVAVAAMYSAVGDAGGEILRTANGGLSWTKVTTAADFNASKNGFVNFVHMFDATEGVALGDPTDGYFEILRTTDGGLTWNRLPQSSVPPVLNASEFGNARSFFARGNTIWAGLASSSPANAVRVLKSTDRGLTWTASMATPLRRVVTRLAFKDDLNGIAYNSQTTGAGAAVNVIRTTDGGANWTTISPVNGAGGSFFTYDIDAADGRYFSTGERFPFSSTPQNADFGSSYSTDGITWTNLNSGLPFNAFDIIGSSSATSVVGYAGLGTDENGVGGLFKGNGTLLATRDAALQRALTVYPNPSASGLFKVDLGGTLKAGAQLSVVDVLGRQVLAQTLSAAAVGAKSVNLNLSNEKAGVYTLQIRTDAGIATQKLVIQ